MTAATLASSSTRAPGCEDCAAGVRFGADGALTCAAHATDDERQLVERIDRYGRQLGLRRSELLRPGQPDATPWGHRYIWPTGAEYDVEVRDRLLGWARRNRVRRSRTSCGCLVWLGRLGCHFGHFVPQGAWFAERSAWLVDGRRLLLCQSPQVGDDDRAEIAALAESYRFRAEIGRGLPANWLGGDGVAVVLRSLRPWEVAAAGAGKARRQT